MNTATLLPMFRPLLVALCLAGVTASAAAADGPLPSSTLPSDRYKLPRLANAWPGLYRMVWSIHNGLGTPLVSNGLFYVVPLLNIVDKQATTGSAKGLIGELRNLPSLGPDGGFLYTWVFWIPGAGELPGSDIHVCYEAVGAARGAGFITPAGEFVMAVLPKDPVSCAMLIGATHPG